MVVIRFQRRGTKKVYHHRIVAVEQNRAQSGRVLETLGHYDPSKQPASFLLDADRFAFWISKGAQVSIAVARMVKNVKRAKPAAGQQPAVAAKKQAAASN